MITPLLALLVAAATALCLGVGRVGADATDRARAQTAADAAALAGALDGEPAARSLAAANGADLVDFRGGDGTAQVVVRYDGARAEARAVAE